MPHLVENCPRCPAQHITMNILYIVPTKRKGPRNATLHEAFAQCRACKATAIFELSVKPAYEEDLDPVNLMGGDVNIADFVYIHGYISTKDEAAEEPPEHLPEEIERAFREAAACLAIQCYNAAGTMFRLCIDLATRDKLPEGEHEGLNSKTRRDLGLRLPWLFKNRYLDEDLRDLSTCIKEDGNDGAHQGTLSEEEAADMLDFTRVLLDRLFTQPERVRLADKRRQERRGQSSGS